MLIKFFVHNIPNKKSTMSAADHDKAERQKKYNKYVSDLDECYNHLLTRYQRIKQLEKTMGKNPSQRQEFEDIVKESIVIENDAVKATRQALGYWLVMNYPRPEPDKDYQNLKNLEQKEIDEAPNAQSKLILKKGAAKKYSDDYKYAKMGFYDFYNRFSEEVINLCDKSLMNRNSDVVMICYQFLKDANEKENGEEIRKRMSAELKKVTIIPCIKLTDQQIVLKVQRDNNLKDIKLFQDRLQKPHGVFEVLFDQSQPISRLIEKYQARVKMDQESGMSKAYAEAVAYLDASAEIPKAVQERNSRLLGSEYQSVLGTFVGQFITSGIMFPQGKMVSLKDFFPGAHIHQNAKDVRLALIALNECETNCSSRPPKQTTTDPALTVADVTNQQPNVPSVAGGIPPPPPFMGGIPPPPPL
jgi:hypothetical protein